MATAPNQNEDEEKTFRLDHALLDKARSRRPTPVPSISQDDLKQAAERVKQKKVVISNEAVSTPWDRLYGELLGVCTYCGDRPIYSNGKGKEAPKKCPIDNHPYVHQGCWDEYSRGTDRACPQMGCEYSAPTPED
jgi:hypothetical protein